MSIPIESIPTLLDLLAGMREVGHSIARQIEHQAQALHVAEAIITRIEQILRNEAQNTNSQG